MPVPAISTSMGTPQTTSDTLPTRALNDASALASIACFPRKMTAVGKSSASRSLATTFAAAVSLQERPSGREFAPEPALPQVGRGFAPGPTLLQVGRGFAPGLALLRVVLRRAVVGAAV